MPLIANYEYYCTLTGEIIPETEYERLAEIASEILYDVCRQKPTEEHYQNELYQKALTYQIEMLYKQGGVDAILGFSEASMSSGSESLGDYSVSGGSSTAQTSMDTIGGIPVSRLAIMMLRRMGLMSRWVYAEYYNGKQKNS